MTPGISGLNSAVAPVVLMISLAVAIAEAVGCCAYATGLIATSTVTTAIGAAARLMNSMNLIFATPSSSSPLDNFHAVWPANNGYRCEADKQTVLHYPRNITKRMRQSGRIVNPPKRGIQDPVAAIRDKSMAIFAAPQRQWTRFLDRFDRFRNRPNGRCQAEGAYFNRKRKMTKYADRLALIGDYDHAGGSRRNNLFPQQRATTTLYQAKAWADLVRAIHGQVKLGRLIQRRQRNSATFRIGKGRLRRGDRDDIETRADPLADQLHKMPCRRPGT